MNSNEFVWCINIACMLAWTLAIVPTAIYVFVAGWNRRRDQLFSYLTNSGLQKYYQQFLWDVPRDMPLRDAFEEQFHRLYGRRHYVLPLSLLTVASASGMICVAHSIRVQLGIADADLELDSVAMSALAGAFMWIIADGLDRIRHYDLAPANVYWWLLRLLISIPFGYAVSAALSENLGMSAAFLLGTFPTQTLFTLGRRLANQWLKLGDPKQPETGLELTNLQSVNRAGAERFQDVGIDTISELAWADPIDITMRTNFDFNYVLDCQSQALLWVYIDDKEKAKNLYQLGLRGAQEVSALMQDLKIIRPDTKLDDDQEAAIATLDQAAKVLGVSQEALYFTLSAVDNDPYGEFIWEIWH